MVLRLRGIDCYLAWLYVKQKKKRPYGNGRRVKLTGTFSRHEEALFFSRPAHFY